MAAPRPSTCQHSTAHSQRVKQGSRMDPTRPGSCVLNAHHVGNAVLDREAALGLRTDQGACGCTRTMSHRRSVNIPSIFRPLSVMQPGRPTFHDVHVHEHAVHRLEERLILPQLRCDLRRDRAHIQTQAGCRHSEAIQAHRMQQVLDEIGVELRLLHLSPPNTLASAAYPRAHHKSELTYLDLRSLQLQGESVHNALGIVS